MANTPRPKKETYAEMRAKTPVPKSRTFRIINRDYWVSNSDGEKLSRYLAEDIITEKEEEKKYSYGNIGVITQNVNGSMGMFVHVRGNSEDEITREVSELEKQAGVSLVKIESTE